MMSAIFESNSFIIIKKLSKILKNVEKYLSKICRYGSISSQKRGVLVSGTVQCLSSCVVRCNPEQTNLPNSSLIDDLEDVNETLDMVCTPQAMNIKQISLTYSYCETDVIVSVGHGLY